ncbi:branched-chain amino acid transport system ATP-binding protein [Pseudoxanthobacter soli DSM 19599]|uniref:Branched-chain amino acid transport system ATP-binding protein n=1 Tax=Pseudoxanthobacter soli DSM 19599 TaxID=1123029 RepID=A0A1M7ZPJ6_9HYPH|nr:ABC transporter ATP-binding protein [Pseudoxanthobacter soli]SHO66729.1 branched-chain amino acid transport system ATP-binding protein [Pseudoxanthobacter soli DSM 19599]
MSAVEMPRFEGAREVEPLLEITGLRVTYGRIAAVDGVDIKIEPGRIVSLVGSNGAGKTTTLAALSGLLPLAGGSIRFAGEDITGLAAELRVGRGIAHVPERRRVFAGMSVRENLLLGGYIRDDKADIERDIEALTELFPILGKRMRQLAGTLSGGEQQMLAIARGLMSRPSLLVMDEPTMGLAPQMIDVVLDSIQEIRNRGTTVLLVEQNAVEAIRLSDHVYVMRLGRIVHEDVGSRIDPERVKAFYMGIEA